MKLVIGQFLISTVVVVVILSTTTAVVDAFLLVPKNKNEVRTIIALTSTKSESSTTTTNNDEESSAPSFGLYEVQEELITNRGKYEEILMDGKKTLLEAFQPNVKGVGSGGGFGGGGKNSKAKKPNKAALKAEGKEFAKVVRRDGVVRFDRVLTHPVADELREFCFTLRQDATEQVANGTVNAKQRFANVLLRKNRCDLTMPLGKDIIYQALYEILCKSPIGATISNILGKDAPLYELSCMISDPGSSRQVIHPDTPCRTSNPKDHVLLTSFVALQDVSLEMGPTCWLPGTHTVDIHDRFRDEEGGEGVPEDLTTTMTIDPSRLSPKYQLLHSRNSVLGVLPKGACGMFDSRLLHCGTANNSHLLEDQNGTPRAIFYTTFQKTNSGYPGNPGSIRPELVGRLTLSELQRDLQTYISKGKETPLLEKLATSLK